MIIAFAQVFTAVFLVEAPVFSDLRFYLLCLSTVLVAAGGYVINDYYDVKIDYVNKPERVVIGKGITRRYALFFHTVLSLSGVAIGFLVQWQIGVINFLSAFLLWWYSNSLKRQPFIGNFVVALLTGLSIILVNVLYDQENGFVIIYALFAFFMTLIREIVKDMEDLKGDNTFGCRTLPIVFGLRKTKVILYILLLLFAGTVLLLNAWFTKFHLYYFLLSLFVPLGFLLARLIRADTKRDFYWLSQWCKVIMLLGVSSMVFI